jgi:RNase P subunit RPR2
MDQEALEQKSKAILTEIREWRRAHPKAKYVEIEGEIHRRMMQLEAQVIQEAAQESEAREWGRGSDQQVPECPNCAAPLSARGKHRRRLQGNAGESVTLNRMYGSCPECGESFFPSR